MYLVAGFRMLFDHRVNIPTVFGSLRFPISVALSNIRKWACRVGHFVHNAFKLFFFRRVFVLLENISQCFYWFKSCKMPFANNFTILTLFNQICHFQDLTTGFLFLEEEASDSCRCSIRFFRKIKDDNESAHVATHSNVCPQFWALVGVFLLCV